MACVQAVWGSRHGQDPMARVRSVADQASLVALFRGHLRFLQPTSFDLDELCRQHQALLGNLLRLTQRPSTMQLQRALENVSPEQGAAAGLVAGALATSVQQLRGKARNSTTGARMSAAIGPLVALLQVHAPKQPLGQALKPWDASQFAQVRLYSDGKVEVASMSRGGQGFLMATCNDGNVSETEQANLALRKKPTTATSSTIEEQALGGQASVPEELEEAASSDDAEAEIAEPDEPEDAEALAAPLAKGCGPRVARVLPRAPPMASGPPAALAPSPPGQTCWGAWRSAL